MYPRRKYVHKKIPTYLGYDIERSASPETGAMLAKKVYESVRRQNIKGRENTKLPCPFLYVDAESYN
jgi:hypothetical protein